MGGLINRHNHLRHGAPRSCHAAWVAVTEARYGSIRGEKDLGTLQAAFGRGT
jgi:hypothetical protein